MVTVGVGEKIVAKTWKQGSNTKGAIVMQLPKHLCKRYGLEKPGQVVLESTEKGILIYKLEL